MMQTQRDKFIPESTPHDHHYSIKKNHNYFPTTAIFRTQSLLIFLPDTIKTHYHTEMQRKFRNLYQNQHLRKAITCPRIRKKLNKKKITPKILMIVAEINNGLGSNLLTSDGYKKISNNSRL